MNEVDNLQEEVNRIIEDPETEGYLFVARSQDGLTSATTSTPGNHDDAYMDLLIASLISGEAEHREESREDVLRGIIDELNEIERPSWVEHQNFHSDS